jgi:hypothetical protein
MLRPVMEPGPAGAGSADMPVEPSLPARPDDPAELTQGAADGWEPSTAQARRHWRRRPRRRGPPAAPRRHGLARARGVPPWAARRRRWGSGSTASTSVTDRVVRAVEPVPAPTSMTRPSRPASISVRRAAAPAFSGADAIRSQRRVRTGWAHLAHRGSSRGHRARRHWHGRPCCRSDGPSDDEGRGHAFLGVSGDCAEAVRLRRYVTARTRSRRSP